MSDTTQGGRAWAWFIAWMVLGIGYSVGLLGALTIGPFVLLVLVVPTILLARRPGANAGLPGLVSGLSVPLFYLAYVNRSGPGTICTAIGATGQECVERSGPWPWFAVGAVLLIGGVAWFLTAARHRRMPEPA